MEQHMRESLRFAVVHKMSISALSANSARDAFGFALLPRPANPLRTEAHPRHGGCGPAQILGPVPATGTIHPRMFRPPEWTCVAPAAGITFPASKGDGEALPTCLG